MTQVRQLSVTEVKKIIDLGEPMQLIDVREPNERDLTHIGGDLIPLGTIVDHIDNISRDKKVVFYCRNGTRSEVAISQLQRQFGFTNLFNMAGGLLSWSNEIDSSIPRY